MALMFEKMDNLTGAVELLIGKVDALQEATARLDGNFFIISLLNGIDSHMPLLLAI